MWTQTSGFQRHGLGDPVLLKWSLPVAILLCVRQLLTLEAKQTHDLGDRPSKFGNAQSWPKLKSGAGEAQALDVF